MFLIYMAMPFGIFLMKQIMSTIPDEIIESGQIDGASEWQIYWHLIVPMARPGIIALGMFTFVMCYGDYFWQLLMTQTEAMRTLPLAIEFFRQGTLTHKIIPDIQLTMAAAFLASLPLLVLYSLFNKYFIEGPSLGSIKG
ncbi:Inner membrane ABC transporter permease protein YcjP [subsurface metagenome]